MAEAPSVLEGPAGGAAGRLPDWYPAWSRRLGELYFSGTTSIFHLFGDVLDLVGVHAGGRPSWVTLEQFVATELFGRWDLVLSYDLAHGIRVQGGGDGKRQTRMTTLLGRVLGEGGPSTVPRDPGSSFAALDRILERNLMGMLDEGERSRKVAILLPFAGYLMPPGPPSSLTTTESTNLVTVLKWASNPYVKNANVAVLLISEKRSDLSAKLTRNPYVAGLEVTLPAEVERTRFLESELGPKWESVSTYTASELGRITAGLSLVNLRTLVRSCRSNGTRLDAAIFSRVKKDLIERECHGLLEFVEPKWTLDDVVGHTQIVARLRDDADLLRRGRLETIPMGYLFCGSVGTGKSFLAECLAGSIGIPCVKLKNFRSKYVGETEGNLEKVLGVLRAMGPVAVLIDEADAALGDRDQEGGDGGLSNRVFAMIAAQMGDTRYRGKILWILMTCRPDRLPIDIKRQGRAEVHVPLFSPQTEDELQRMFVVMAGKVGASLKARNVPAVDPERGLSGADVEGIVGRAWRNSLLAGRKSVTAKFLGEALDGFIPSAQGAEKELQELVAVLECTDRSFLPPRIGDRVEALGGTDGVRQEVRRLARLVELDRL